MTTTAITLALLSLAVGLFLLLAVLLAQWRDIVDLQRDVAALKGDDAPTGRHGGDR